MIKNKKLFNKNELKSDNFFKKSFDIATVKFVFKKNMIIENKSLIKIDLFQKFIN